MTPRGAGQPGWYLQGSSATAVEPLRFLARRRGVTRRVWDDFGTILPGPNFEAKWNESRLDFTEREMAEEVACLSARNVEWFGDVVRC